MIKKENIEYLKDIKFFNRLVKDSFKFKRKTMRNNLNGYDLDIVNSVLNKYGFDISCRSEVIPYNIFVEIANELIK